MDKTIFVVRSWSADMNITEQAFCYMNILIGPKDKFSLVGNFFAFLTKSQVIV